MNLVDKFIIISGLSICAATASIAAGPGDFDGDGDIDFNDFEHLATCQLGPDGGGDEGCLDIADYDFDTDVDITDLASFQRCFGGSGVPVSPTCAPHIVRIEDRALIVIGTAADSIVRLRLRAGVPGVLELDLDNDGAFELNFDRALFDEIVMHARGGNDGIIIDEANGVFTNTETTFLSGGSGEDLLVGGSGGESFDGGSDTDQIFMGAGDDHCFARSGTATDRIEGEAGQDVVTFLGSDVGESFTLTANGPRVRFDQITAPVTILDIAGCEQIFVSAGGGNDTFACTGNLAALIRITADGGSGDDTLLGSNGDDFLVGGDDDDFIDGQQGSDVAFLGAGDDTFQWDPGDGSDTIEGQTGFDDILFNGSNGSETFDCGASGTRLRFARNLGNIVLNAAGVEQINLFALGSTDIVNVNDLSTTDVQDVLIDLGGFGGTPDAATDTVNVLGTAAAEAFELFGQNGFTIVERGSAVRVRGYEGLDQVAIVGVGGDLIHANGTDGDDAMTVTANGTVARIDAPGYSAGVNVSGTLQLIMKGHAGNDQISCTGNLASLVPITFDGGSGDDTLLGSNGADVLLGGDDDDFVDGQQGTDVAFLGSGDDTFQWDPGDGNDSIEGQAGFDALRFNGSNASEVVEFSANGSRLRFTRNIANIVLDAAGMEQFDLIALGGTDIINVNDLTQTEIEFVSINLGLFGGGTDAAADTINVNGSDQPDTMQVTADGGALEVLWPAGLVRISAADATLDTLNVNGLGGNDNITAGAGTTSLIRLFLNQ